MVDDDLNVLAPGSGIVGKVARGGNIPIGYYKDEEKTRATFVTAKDGRRYVVAGDFAQWEADGTITLLGRGSMCINSGGEKIFPEEVESALKSHPDVFDALVVGGQTTGGVSVWLQLFRPGRIAFPTSTSSRRTAARRSPATRCRVSCTWSTASSVRPAASPTTRGPRSWWQPPTREHLPRPIPRVQPRTDAITQHPIPPRVPRRMPVARRSPGLGVIRRGSWRGAFP